RVVTHRLEEVHMRNAPNVLAAGVALALAAPGVLADADLDKQLANPSNWAMQAGDMYNQRYSKLNQINKSNVGKMQVAWLFSTGVLRGHAGSPLVVDGVVDIHTPFPDKALPVNLDDEKTKCRLEP